MSLKRTKFQKIQKITGRKQTNCDCELCQQQCRILPCLGTPEDILKIIEAGFGERVIMTYWWSGLLMGVADRVIGMVQPRMTPTGCTFFKEGKCELHDLGLKPTEGKLSHHLPRKDDLNPHKSIAWAVAKTWIKQ